jgi:hypothetical protein
MRAAVGTIAVDGRSHSRADGSVIEAVIETPRYDFTRFKVTFESLAGGRTGCRTGAKSFVTLRAYREM